MAIKALMLILKGGVIKVILMAKTNSEAVRMALLNFGLNIGAVKNKTILDSIRKDLSKDALSVEEIDSGIRKAKDETVHG